MRVYIFAGTLPEAQKYACKKKLREWAFIESMETILGARMMPFVRVGTWKQRNDLDAIDHTLKENNMLEWPAESKLPSMFRHNNSPSWQFVAYFHFVSWAHISLGFHIDMNLPNIEVHVPFGFFRIGIVRPYPVNPRTFGIGA